MIATTEISEKSFTLRDGSEILIRGINPEDKHHFIRGIQKLSNESMYHRFHSHFFSLNKYILEYFTNVDQVDHLAIGAIDLQDKSKPGIAVARYIRNPDKPDTAEVAVTVLDEYQGKGIGSLLFSELCKLAIQHKITTFTILVHTERRNLQKYLFNKGAVISGRDGHVTELSLPLEINKFSNV